MGDKELLELAAKAAGYAWRKDVAEIRDAKGIAGLWIIGGSTGWNPLSDDGDALRLAVKLNLVNGKVFARLFAGHYDEIGDIYSATRRAIVLAAAEIGASM